MSRNAPTYTRTAPASPPDPLPNRLIRLLSEARWLLLAVLCAYLTLVMFTYSTADSGWSHAGMTTKPSNWGGSAGAWLSDLMFYVFGFSAWWWCVALMAAVWGFTLPLALALSRVLDALALGEDTARSLGVPLGLARGVLVGVLAASTAAAVAQAGLVAFVGLAAPHLVRGISGGRHRVLLWAASAMGGVLMLVSDVLARGLLPPQELPVGVLTAVLGGVYLLVLLHRRSA